MKFNTSLTPNDLQKLRAAGLLFEGEVAIKEGDVIVAENLLTKQRRILNVSGLILEANRQLLND